MSTERRTARLERAMNDTKAQAAYHDGSDFRPGMNAQRTAKSLAETHELSMEPVTVTRIEDKEN